MAGKSTPLTFIIGAWGKVFTLTFLCTYITNAQSLGDYRTNGNTNFSSPVNWEYYNGNSWIPAFFPPSSLSGVITIRNGHNATVPNTVVIDQVVVENGGTITVDSGGKLLIGSNSSSNHGIIFEATGVVNGPGSFEISSAKLTTANINGISATAMNGSVQVTGVRTFNSNSTYEYNGTSPQVTGDGLPSNVENLFINNPAGVTSVNHITIDIDGLLKLQVGNLDMNGFDLTISTYATIDCSASSIVLGVGSNFTLSQDAILKTANVDGISLSSSQGSIQVTGMRNYHQNAIYEYNGTTMQNTGDVFSTSDAIIVINNPSGVVASNSITISSVGTLRLEGGNLIVNHPYHLNIEGVIECNTYQVAGTGSFSLADDGQIMTANTNGVMGSIAVTGSQTFAPLGEYLFNNAFSPQSTGFPNSITTVHELIVNLGMTNNYVSLNKDIHVSGGVLIFGSGDFNLNGKNLFLDDVGGIVEDYINQGLIKDFTATTELGVKGGFIEATNRIVDHTSGDIGGLGISFRTLNPFHSYNDLKIRRYHYTASNGIGIRLIYQIFSPSVSSNPTVIGFRLPFDEENPNNINVDAIYRWSAGSWQAIPSSLSCTNPPSQICTSSPQTSFSSWSLGNNSNAQLPITLLSFDAKRIGQTPEVLLQWRTAQEIN
ncbi:MAG: hypothetical protein NZ551_01930, partial [Microscillaceae bacterium]|nr:hypothetical protein [Microscillaceae bacterium]MDW8459946.1 hypothetical protein [Cytophagales bacterium]